MTEHLWCEFQGLDFTVATLSVSCSELSEAFPQLLKPIPNIVQAIDAANVSRFIAVYGILIGV